MKETILPSPDDRREPLLPMAELIATLDLITACLKDPVPDLTHEGCAEDPRRIADELDAQARRGS